MQEICYNITSHKEMQSWPDWAFFFWKLIFFRERTHIAGMADGRFIEQSFFYDVKGKILVEGETE